MIELSFPDLPAAQAGILAQKLRLAILRAGADEEDVRLAKENPEAMDAGSIVQYINSALEIAVLAKLIYELCQPSGAATMEFKTPKEKVVVNIKTLSGLEEIKSILRRYSENGSE
jgi:hypothetical protein